MSDQMGVFGVWDAPATDGMLTIEVPADRTCMYCREGFAEGQNGAVFETGYAAHRECSLRSVMGGIGHCVDHARYCSGELGPDAGLSYRESAVLTWAWFQHDGWDRTYRDKLKLEVLLDMREVKT